MSETDNITWLNTKEACARLGCNLRTIYRLIDEGQLKAHHLGRVIRIQEADLDAFIEASVIRPGSIRHLYPAAKGGES